MAIEDTSNTTVRKDNAMLLKPNQNRIGLLSSNPHKTLFTQIIYTLGS